MKQLANHQELRRASSSRKCSLRAARTSTLTSTRPRNTVEDRRDESSSLASPHGLAMHGRSQKKFEAQTKRIEPHVLTRIISSCRTPNELLTLLQHHSTCLNEIHLSAAMVKLAKHQGKEDNQELALCTAFIAPLIRKSTPTWTAKESSRAVANIIWSAAKLIERIERAPSIERSLSAKAQRDLIDLSSLLLLHHLPLCILHFKAQHVSNSAYALSILSKHKAANEGLSSTIPYLVSLILNRARDLLIRQEFNEPQAFANLIYSLSVTDHSPDPTWMDLFLDSCEPLLHLFEPMHISSTLTALSTLSYHPGEAWLGSAMQAMRIKLRISSPQSLANVLWSIARLGCKEEEIQSGGDLCEALDELMGEVAARSSLFSAQDCSNILWSLAKMVHSIHKRHLSIHTSLISCMSRPLILNKALPQDISNALWAVSILKPEVNQAKYQDDAMRKDLEAIALRLSEINDGESSRGLLMAQCKPQELSNVAIAVARLGLMKNESSSWWQALYESSLPLLSPSAPLSMQAQHISNIIWAAARSGNNEPPDAWLSSALDAFVKKLQKGEATDQAVACVLWSLAKIDSSPPHSVLKALLEAFSIESSTDQGLSMVLWAVATMKQRERHKGRPSPSGLLLSSSYDRMMDAVMDRVDQLEPRALIICLQVMAGAKTPPNLSKMRQKQLPRLIEASRKTLPSVGAREARSILKSLVMMGYQPLGLK